MKKKLFAMLLICCMIVGLTSCTQAPSGSSSTSAASASGEVQSSDASSEVQSTIPDYVNMDSALPFVKDGTKVTLEMYVAAQENAKEVRDTWLWTYLQDKGNVTLDITLIPWSAKNERKNLALSTGIIPDIMYNMQLDANDLVTYGSGEHVLADLSGLIDTVAPDLKAMLDAYPIHRAQWTTPDGAIYSLSNLANYAKVANYAMWVNKDWMAAAGVTELPKTLDDFTAMLVRFKETNPKNLADDAWAPLGGYSGADDATIFILQALGFQINSFRQERIYDVAVVGDHISVICCDDLYAEYLRIAHDWYEQGLILKDYFTVDWKTTRAQAGLGECGAYPQFSMGTMVNNGFVDGDNAAKDAYIEKWLACSPLTSKWNDTPVALANTGTSIGNFTISEKCKNKEVAMRLANWFYTSEGNQLQSAGPMKDGDTDTYGLLDGWEFYTDPEDNQLKIEQNVQLSIYSGYECLGFENYIVGQDTGLSKIAYQYKIGGHENEFLPEGEFNMELADNRVNKQRYDAVAQYAVDGMPSILYMDSETAARAADLKAVVSNYATSETAKFINGSRSIDEVDDFLRQIRLSGGDELNRIYNDAYQKYQAEIK